MRAVEAVDVAVIGGGPAGAAVAGHLASRGWLVAVLERTPAWRWRACGVFSSPASVTALHRTGLSETTLARVTRPIPAMRVETVRGTRFRLTYGDHGLRTAPAVGFDRSALDPALLDQAADCGADVRRGVAVRAVRLPSRRGEPAELEVDDGQGGSRLRAAVVIGADGARSLVARAAGVRRRSPLADRIGLTFHVPDPVAGAHDARMVVLHGGYVGLAPVPGGRVNVGIVLDGRWRDRLRKEGGRATATAILARVAPELADSGPCDHLAGAMPLAHGVARRAGPGWLLVGDAAGFLDPFTGEGLHRALVSAELAAIAIDGLLHGHRRDLEGYSRAMRRRFRGKDVVSLLVQLFLSRPALFEHAAIRLAARPDVRETMGLVMGDLAPASHALDPRFLAALLRP